MKEGMCQTEIALNYRNSLLETARSGFIQYYQRDTEDGVLCAGFLMSLDPEKGRIVKRLTGLKT